MTRELICDGSSSPERERGSIWEREGRILHMSFTHECTHVGEKEEGREGGFSLFCITSLSVIPIFSLSYEFLPHSDIFLSPYFSLSISAKFLSLKSSLSSSFSLIPYRFLGKSQSPISSLLSPVFLSNYVLFLFIYFLFLLNSLS